MERRTVDGNSIVALLLVLFMGSHVLGDVFKSPSAEIHQVQAQEFQPNSTETNTNKKFVSPYINYVLTQGPHGYSYGHMAVDLSAGQGATIHSPINGTITANNFDGLGNSTLIIENTRYKITLLHGEYILKKGDKVNQGDLVGYESNLGNTTDLQGRSCRGRPCGYHTHLNVFDKKLNQNVNPLDLMGK